MNTPDEKGGWTPLHLAAWFSTTPSVVAALLAAGADPAATDNAGKTPWDYARSNAALEGTPPTGASTRSGPDSCMTHTYRKHDSVADRLSLAVEENNLMNIKPLLFSVAVAAFVPTGTSRGARELDRCSAKKLNGNRVSTAAFSLTALAFAAVLSIPLPANAVMCSWAESHDWVDCRSSEVLIVQKSLLTEKPAANNLVEGKLRLKMRVSYTSGSESWSKFDCANLNVTLRIGDKRKTYKHIIPYTSGVADYIEDSVAYLFAPPFRKSDIYVESVSCKIPRAFAEEKERLALEEERERLALEREREQRELEKERERLGLERERLELEQKFEAEQERLRLARERERRRLAEQQRERELERQEPVSQQETAATKIRRLTERLL